MSDELADIDLDKRPYAAKRGSRSRIGVVKPFSEVSLLGKVRSLINDVPASGQSSTGKGNPRSAQDHCQHKQ